MAKFLYEDEWLQAMSKEDGFKLIHCLTREPRLLTLQYKGRNALHLAMRHDWYGLVQEIFLQFKHLYNAGEQSERREEEDENSSQLLDLDSLRDLLTCKEGTSDADSSGLDVLAMAVIQCHQGINTLLVKMISSLPKLFPLDHTYHGVASCTLFVGEEDTDKEKDTDEPESKLHYRKKVCEVLEDCFPNFSACLKLDHASNMCFDDEQIQTDKGSRTRLFNLDPQTEPEIYMWMLTSPFLPFSEYLILDYCCNWRKRETLLSRTTPFIDRILSSDGMNPLYRRQIGYPGSRDEIDLFKYLLGISDTRRRVLHYVALNSSSSEFHPFLDRLHLDWSYFTLMRDGSGRTVGHLLVTMDPPPFERVSQLFNGMPFFLPNWDPVGREVWAYDGWQCSIKLRLVHRANAYPYYQQDSLAPEARSLSLGQIIYTSPYLTETARKTWMDFPFVNPFKGYVNSLRPSVNAGVTRDLLLTPLVQCVLMGSNNRVKQLAQDDEYYDAARIKCQQALNLDVHSYTEKSALQFAAERAEPGILRIILRTGKFDTQYEDGKGNTLLHSAVLCKDVTCMPLMLTDFLEVPDNSSGKLPGLEQSLKATDQQSEEEQRHRESRRQSCINLLLQEGIDIWQTNNAGDIADPGPKASSDYSSWWYEKLTRETQDQKSSFSGTATAISVIAALVAIASILHLYLHLYWYSSEDVDQIAKAQAGLLPERVFFVCNTLAFYLAVAAVVFSLTPSIPMPHASTIEALKRIRRCVTWAFLLLIIALIAVLSAFASASIVVLPNGGKWNHGGLTTSGVVVGCIVCIAVLILCCARAVKLVFHNNRAVDGFYRKWVCI